MNTLVNNPYYKEMLKRNRLLPFFYKGKMICFISFFIGNKNEEGKFVRDDPWSVLDDDSNGDMCFIDQLWTNKTSHWINHKLTYMVWHNFKNFIKENYPQAEYIYFRRWKNNKVNIYIKRIRNAIYKRTTTI